MREGSLEAPTRHPLDWQNPWFWDEAALEKEMERVFDICHGCRRCFNLCDSFPRLFDLIDNGPSGEGYVRLSLTVPDSRLEEAVDRITRALVIIQS